MASAERIPLSTAKRAILSCVLSSDHASPATGKTVAVQISKNGAAYANPSAGATNATEIGNGDYYVDLSTTDTNTAGPLIVCGTASGVDIAKKEYAVNAKAPATVNGADVSGNFGIGGFTCQYFDTVDINLNGGVFTIDATNQDSPGLIVKTNGADVPALLFTNLTGNGPSIAFGGNAAFAQGIGESLPTFFSSDPVLGASVSATANVTLSPLQASLSLPPYITKDITPVWQNSAPSFTWIVNDQSGNPVSYAGKEVRLVLFSDPDSPTAIAQYDTTAGNVTISGASNNNITVQFSATDTATVQNLHYQLWNITDNLPIAEGKFPIKPAVKQFP